MNPEVAMGKAAYNMPALQDRWKENMTFAEFGTNSMQAYKK